MQLQSPQDSFGHERFSAVTLSKSPSCCIFLFILLVYIFVPYFLGSVTMQSCFPWQQLLGHSMSPEETSGHAKFTVGPRKEQKAKQGHKSAPILGL